MGRTLTALSTFTMALNSATISQKLIPNPILLIDSILLLVSEKDYNRGERQQKVMIFFLWLHICTRFEFMKETKFHSEKESHTKRLILGALE